MTDSAGASDDQPSQERHRLRQDLGLGGAVVTGLGSIVGTGVFVSIAVSFGVWGREALFAVPLAALVATFNGLSSAQLAAVHPVSGGTYEYGYRFLSPWAGFSAGWLFLIAKTASAATAAIGFAAYLADLLGAPSSLVVPIALGVSAAITGLVITGIRRTALVNAVLVAVTVGALVTFIAAGLLEPTPDTAAISVAPGSFSLADLLAATAFLFVAYTGYGRIATLGEEVRDPAVTIPRAVVTTLAVSAALYTGVAIVVARLGGPDFTFEEGAAALAELVGNPWVTIVEIGAIVAMAGVLLNLVLGLSRVWLAMGRRDDMPSILGRVSASGSPTPAVILTGVAVAGVAAVGDVRLTWSFSAFSVLLYYAITNAAALRIPAEDRRFPRWVSWAGLGSCGFLSLWVDPAVLVVGVGVIVAGVGFRAVRQRFV